LDFTTKKEKEEKGLSDFFWKRLRVDIIIASAAGSNAKDETRVEVGQGRLLLLLPQQRQQQKEEEDFFFILLLVPSFSFSEGKKRTRAPRSSCGNNSGARETGPLHAPERSALF